MRPLAKPLVCHAHAAQGKGFWLVPKIVDARDVDELHFHPDEMREVKTFRIGVALKSGRIARNLSIEAVAELTRMRALYIKALETGQLEAFSKPFYAIGFARVYARMLDLDTEWVKREMCCYIEETTPQWRRSC